MTNLIIHDILNPEPKDYQVLFPIDHHPYVNLKHKNLEIAKVYTNIITEIRFLISRMVIPEHRSYILNHYPFKEPYNDVIFEFVSVLCCLTLSAKEGCYIIELETDCDIVNIVGDLAYRKMIRAAYKATMWDFTNHTIEDSLFVDTMKLDHYQYYKNRLKENYPNTIILDEDPVVE